MCGWVCVCVTLIILYLYSPRSPQLPYTPQLCSSAFDGRCSDASSSSLSGTCELSKSNACIMCNVSYADIVTIRTM